MYVKGVRCIIDLFDENQNFLDFVELKRNFNIQINNLTFMQVRQALLSDLRKYSFIRNEVFIPFVPYFYNLGLNKQEIQNSCILYKNQTNVTPAGKEKRS